MSDTEDTPNKASVSIDTVTSAVEAYKNSRKERTYELPDPEGDGTITLWFEYRKLDEDEIQTMHDSATRTKPTRSGQSNEQEFDGSALMLETIKKGVTDTNIEGFTTSDRKIRQATTVEIRADLSKAINSFSEMEEETREKFR